jgi:hypothetical protein
VEDLQKCLFFVQREIRRAEAREVPNGL